MSVKYFSPCHCADGLRTPGHLADIHLVPVIKPQDDTTSLKLRSAGVFIFSACACVLNFTTLKTEINGVEK